VSNGVRLGSRRPFVSNIRTILLTEGAGHHSNELFITTFCANFVEHLFHEIG
jgi:hypothetical protein